MNKPENSGLSDEELLAVATDRWQAWDFTAHDDAENVDFAHELSAGIVDAFSRGLGHMYSSEFHGEELPELLKPLHMTLWHHRDRETKESVPQVSFPSDMHVWLQRRGDDVQEPIRAPQAFFDIMQAAETFHEAVAQLEANPDLIQRIDPGSLILDDAVIIRTGEGYSRNGLELVVEQDDIAVFAFGNQGETHSLCEFMLRYHHRQTRLAEMAAHLSILAAKYFNGPWPSPASDLRYSDSDARLRGDTH